MAEQNSETGDGEKSESEQSGNKQTDEKNGEENKDEKDEKTPVLEWFVAAIGLILVIGVVGFMLYQASNKHDAPPNIEIIVDSVTPNKSGYLVEFEVKNSGEKTAAAVMIEGELKKGEETIETSTSTLTYAPSNSARKGGLFFSKNPRQFNLEIRATAYEAP